MVSLLPISSHVALPLISEQTETSLAALVLASHHITSHHIIKEDKKSTKGLHHNNWCGQTCDLQVLGLILSSRWRFLWKERTWWVMTHQWCGTSKDYLTRKSYSRIIGTEDSVKVPRYDFLFPTITFKTFINLYHPDQNKVCAHITSALTFWQP